MTIPLPTPDPAKVKKTVAKLRQHRLAIEEATLILEDLTAQLEHTSRQKNLARIRSQRASLFPNLEITKFS